MCDQIEATADSGIEGQLRLFREFIDECMVCFKEPKWAPEREWRAVVFNNGYLGSSDWPLLTHYRDGASGPTPYVELPISVRGGDGAGFVLRQILVGAGLDITTEEPVVRDLLRQRFRTDGDGVTVVRPWEAGVA